MIFQYIAIVILSSAIIYLIRLCRKLHEREKTMKDKLDRLSFNVKNCDMLIKKYQHQSIKDIKKITALTEVNQELREEIENFNKLITKKESEIKRLKERIKELKD